MAQSSRRWGYHQLTPRAARRLVADADLPADALVLDIGAGRGAITGPLVDAAGRVIAIELHPGRVRQLDERFGRRAVVVRADASDLRLPRRPFHVVANPPYAITTAIVRRLLHPRSRLVSAHLVLPRWAVRRWTRPGATGRGGWGRVFDVSAGPPVPRSAFRPPPPTDSQILVIRRRE